MRLSACFLSVCTVLIFSVLVAQAQDAPEDSTRQWTKKASFGLNFAQVQLNNWAGGGESSISVTGLMALSAIKKTDKMSWTNSLDLTYGQARLGKQAFRKTDDQLLIRSMYNRKLSERWGIAGGADFRTQIDRGFNFTTDNNTGEEIRTLISDFMAPAYLNLNIGLSYARMGFKAILSPIASKFTFVLNDELSAQGAYGVEEGKRVRSELAGASLNITADYNLMENVKFKTNFLAFTEYKGAFSEVDFNWDTQLLFTVNKFIKTSITTQLIYDEDVQINREDGTVGPAVQFKGVLNIGLLYTIQ
jgi:hypothetical protein